MFGLTCIASPQKFCLKSVSVNCNVRNLLVMCTSEMVYKNDTGENAEALFSFPLEGSCVVYHFEAVIGGKAIVGICKELEEAKNMYKVATEAGQKAALIERSTSMTDVFKCRIGNMPKDTEAKIMFKFAMELKLSLTNSDCDDVHRFTLCLPLILRPRYTPQDYVGNTDVYHVSNMYEYSFKAIFSGTKEIRNIFSNNHQLKLVIEDSKKMSGQIILESKYDGTHDLDIYIDYVKMKVPSVLYEFGTDSKRFVGKPTQGAFYKNDVAMLNFLPEFQKVNEVENKMEIVIVVDRSGSMDGSNIKNAKECLLIFLKSLPTNCKFQIYGFGSTFDKVFPLPQLYDDQSIATAMNYQRNLDANLGGTELMNPLKDVYSSKLTKDYSRVVFLLTDGDVGNQDEVFRLVRKHNHSTRLFTVGIGDGVSTSLVQKVAESGNGKSAFVRDSNTLSATVIELLDVALNCDTFTDCKVEWQCSKIASVVMVPTHPGPIFSNYFLTIFCMINDLEEGDSIKCNLSGKVNGKPMHLSLDVNSKDGVSDEEFRVHRLLAKYKIDEMTSMIEDGNTDLKKSLIELSLEVNMVSNYTTFVAIDHETPDQVLAVEDYEPPVAMACFMKCAMRRYQSAQVCSDVGMDYDMPSMEMPEKCYAAPPAKMKSEKKKKSKSGKTHVSPPLAASSSPRENKEAVIDDIVLYLADKQNINGSWNMNEELIKKLALNGTKIKGLKPDEVSENVWMTVILYQYLVVKMAGRESEWKLFVKKAKQWLSSTLKDSVKMDNILKEGLAVI